MRPVTDAPDVASTRSKISEIHWAWVCNKMKDFLLHRNIENISTKHEYTV